MKPSTKYSLEVRERAAGRFRDADPQLVRTGDEFVAPRLYGGDEQTLDGRVVALACGVCRPDEAREAASRARWRLLSGFRRPPRGGWDAGDGEGDHALSGPVARAVGAVHARP